MIVYNFTASPMQKDDNKFLCIDKYKFCTYSNMALALKQFF